MKLSALLFTISVILMFSACSEDGSIIEERNILDAQLIEEIKSDQHLNVISISDLSADILLDLEINYSAYFAMSIWESENIGYRINLLSRITEDVSLPKTIYFSTKGRLLKNDGRDQEVDPNLDDEEESSEECFEFVYPISFTMPDGSNVVGDNSQSVSRDLRSWYSENRGQDQQPILNFPVNIKYGGEEITINDHQALQKVKDVCNGDIEGDEVIDDRDEGSSDITADEGDDLPSDDQDDESSSVESNSILEFDCFELVFPVQLSLSDGTRIAGETKESLIESLNAWKANHPEADENIAFLFPLKVVTEGVEETISSQEEFKLLEDSCDADGGSGSEEVNAEDDSSSDEFDCPDAGANVGDRCVDQNLREGTLSRNCECLS